MKNAWKRLLSALLVAMMILCFAACNGTQEETSSAPSGSTNSGTTSTNPENPYIKDNMYVPKLGVLDEYKGRTFKILVEGEDKTTYQSDDFTTEAGSGGINYGDGFYSKVKTRNEKIEQDYDIKLEVYKIEKAATAGREDASIGNKAYDAMVLGVGSVRTMAQEDLLCNLRNIETFDADAPWWDAEANESYSVAGKLYFTTGDITIMNKANTWAILFNKQMIEDNPSLDSPYTLFENGTWTFDKMAEMARTASNATATSDWKDTSVNYGMVTAYGDILMFYGGSGNALCSLGADGMPELTFGNDASLTNTQKILQTMNTADWKIYAQECTGGGNVWDESFRIFYSGRALFRPSGFTATTKLRALAEMPFGVVPMPKIDETQDAYWTVSTGSFVACIAKTAEDPKFSAYMLDAFAAGAKNYITDEYVETNLKYGSLRDEESLETVNYIFSHIKYDVGVTYDFGGITSIFSDLAKNKSDAIQSSLDEKRGTIESKIQEVVDDYMTNSD